MTKLHVVPEASYTLATAERNGLPAVAILNLAYANFDHCADYPWLLSISLEVEDQSDNGLPTDAEAEVLNWVEDAIEAELALVTPFHHVARQSWNGERIIDYYVEAGDKALACMESLDNSGRLPRALTATIERDPEWSSWLPMLQTFV